MKEKLVEFLEVMQGWRKFTVCFFVLFVSIIFRIKNLVNGEEWADVAKAVALGFFGTNSLEGVTEVLKNHLALRRAAGNVLVTPPDTTKDTDSDPEVEIAPIQTGNEQ